MGVEGNGKVTDSTAKGMNGHTVVSKSRSATAKSSRLVRLFSIFARVLTWYSIISIIFRCPASVELLVESSPGICNQYFQIKSQIAPHITPYYNTYAAPCVDAARPYYDVLDEKLIAPASAYGRKYGVPRLAQAQTYSQAQWEKSIQPQISRFSGMAQQQYAQNLAPLLVKAVNLTSPYYAIARDSALQTYYESILPTYSALQPYAHQVYEVVNKFTVETAIPYAQWAWNTGVTFLDRTVWLKIRVLYGENVEPQLVRIGERLGRYRDGKKLQAAVDEIEIPSSESPASSMFSSSVPSTHASVSPTGSTIAPQSSQVSLTQHSKKAPISEEETRENARRIVSTDLKSLQEKFAKAADDGSDELDKRIIEITDRYLQNQAQGVGETRLIQLEETIKSELENLQTTMITIVKESLNIEASEKDLNAAVRKAGSAIKGKAQVIRAWRKSYDTETNSLVSQAATETFEIIDHIRDLGLQEIGMRWAWTEGITHKDWSKYHAVKAKFDEWRKDVEEVATAHRGLARAREASEDIENRAMAMAEDAVKELIRLKETGRWKLSVGDSSDDFRTKYMPAAAAVAGQKILDKVSEVSEAILGTPQGILEQIRSVAGSSTTGTTSSASSITAPQADDIPTVAAEAGKNASSVASSISSSLPGTPQGSVESVVSVAKSSGGGLADKASSSIIGTQQESADRAISAPQVSTSSFADKASNSIISIQQGSAEGVMPAAEASTNSIVKKASSSMISDSKESMETIASVVSNIASSISVKVSSSVIGPELGVVERALNGMCSVASALSEAIPMGGLGDSISSLYNMASSSFSSGTSKAAKSASSTSSSASSAALSTSSSSISRKTSKSASGLSKDVSSSSSSASATTSKKVWGGAVAQFVEAEQIIYEEVLEDDDSNYSEKIQSMAGDVTKAVSEALLKPGSTQGPAGNMTSLAAEQYSMALSAASIAYYGAQPGIRESTADIASSRYADAIAAASSVIYGTPSPTTSYVASQASAAYSDALSMASSHYSLALSIVSAQISGTPKPIHEQMFASVHSAYSDSVEAASSRLQAALSMTPILSPEKSAASTQLTNAQTYASSQWSAASTGTNGSAFYVPPRGALESISSVAASKLSAGLSIASARYESTKSAVGATQTVVSQRYLAEAQKQYYAGIGLAHARYSEFFDAASRAIMPAPTPFHQSLDERASTGFLDSSAAAYKSVLNAAQSRYSDAVAAAISSLDEIMSSFSGDKKASATHSLAVIASSRYSSAIAAASDTLASASSAARGAVFETPTGTFDNIASEISEKAESIASQASTALCGSETSWAGSVASVASENWEALLTKASVQIYGAPTPFQESMYSEAGEYAARVTDGAAAQYMAVQSLISELVSGREPDFTKSVYSRFSSAYYTGVGAAVSSASSIAIEAHASASSAISSIFTPPPKLEAILDSVSSRVNDAVEAASIQFYGTPKGAYEQATSSVVSAYSSASSIASVKIYGSSTGYAEAASSSIADIAVSAQQAIMNAIYGTSTAVHKFATTAVADAYASATSVVAENLSAATSVVGETYGAAHAKVSCMMFGPEQGTVKSAHSRLNAAAESARLKVAQFARAAGEYAGEAVGRASESIEEFASGVSIAVGSTVSTKDEL